MQSNPLHDRTSSENDGARRHPTAMSRRRLLQTGALAAIAAKAGLPASPARAQERGARPERVAGVEVLNPRGRVPVSLIIDDSTCLVNLAHFGMPQFAEAFPDRTTSRTGGSCRARSPTPSSASSASGATSTASRASTASCPIRPASAGSTATCPAGRSRSCDESLDLVRDADDAQLGHPSGDGLAHPGHRHEDRPALSRLPTEQFMENWGWTDGKSVDELADYMATPCGFSRTSACRAKGSPRPAASATACCPSWPRPRCSRAATCSRPRFRTTSGTCSPTSRAWPRGSSTPRASTAPTRSASSRSSAARATGSAAGTA